MPKIGAVSLGCDKNRVDTENMLAYFSEAGWTVTSDVSEADVVVVNTCSFIGDAKKESIDAILDIAALKQKREFRLVVTGCLPQRYGDKIAGLLPEVDLFTGIADYSALPELIASPPKERVCIRGCDTFTENRVLTTDYSYAYLKVSDGCDNHCTYCAIPMIRGPYRSRDMDSLVRETRTLVTTYGVKEINLVAQDLTRYGKDIYGRYAITELIDKLSQTGVSWIRLLYCYPELVTDELIEAISANDKVCKYIDIPLQHINDGVLKRMGRRSNRAQIENLIEKLRKKIPSVAIRSTFITGFPGETEEAFSELKDFVIRAEFDYAGFFAYSAEEDTPAVGLKGRIPQRIKQQRKTELEKVQSAITESKQKSLIGTTQRVLYQGIDFDRQMFVGRTERNAPDIDTVVYFKSDKPVEAGNFYDVKIVNTRKLNLTGVLK